jgi:hypothetical protein
MEDWRPVVGHEGEYEVSDLGRVRSLDRERMFRNRYGTLSRRVFKGKVLGPYPNHNGDLIVNLWKDGKMHARRVHHLVLEAFVGLRPQGTEAMHDDDAKTNNALANLSWGTGSENKKQMWKNCIGLQGGRVHIKSLTE